MTPIDDPVDLTPEERFEAVATILARGYVRLRLLGRSFVGQLSPGKPEESPEKALAGPLNVSPHVPGN
jgi:hypothetical protein